MKHVCGNTRMGWMVVLICLLLVGMLMPASVSAKDYVVTFVRETYKENTGGDSSAAKVYHTWEIETDFGKKLLILNGIDPVKRKWLRDFTAEYKLFLAKIPNVDSGSFELDTVFEIDLKNLHPVNDDFASGKKKKKKK